MIRQCPRAILINMPKRGWRMRFAVALFLLACPMSAASAAPLDEWCAQVTLPASIAICSDPDLRVLAIERQRAFDGQHSQVGVATNCNTRWQRDLRAPLVKRSGGCG